MLLKAAVLFLVVMGALGIWGRARAKRRAARLEQRPTARLARTCPACGMPRIGKGPCPCGAKG